jgi:hypothetical protein
MPDHMHPCTHTPTHTYIHAHTHPCMHTHIHACTHTSMHAHIHPCMHAYIQKKRELLRLLTEKGGRESERECRAATEKAQRRGRSHECRRNGEEEAAGEAPLCFAPLPALRPHRGALAERRELLLHALRSPSRQEEPRLRRSPACRRSRRRALHPWELVCRSSFRSFVLFASVTPFFVPSTLFTGKKWLFCISSVSHFLSLERFLNPKSLLFG